MKRKKALVLGIVFALTCGVYAAYCLRAFFIKPSLEFGEFIDPAERKVISDWYARTDIIPPLRMDVGSIAFALTHPYSPNPYRPLVSEGGLGGEGSIQLSYGERIAIFRIRDGLPVFEYVIRFQ